MTKERIRKNDNERIAFVILDSFFVIYCLAERKGFDAANEGEAFVAPLKTFRIAVERR